MNIYIQTIKEISLTNKYTRIYIELMEMARSRATTKKELSVQLISEQNPKGFCYKHHIIPRSFKLGGEKDKENLAFLTTREHFMAHRLLTKMFSKKTIFYNKMIYAMYMMMHTGDTKFIFKTSRTYEQTSLEMKKIKSAKKLSEAHNNALHAHVKNITPERREEMSTSRKNDPRYGNGSRGKTGVNSPSYGKKASDHTKKLIGESKKGKKSFFYEKVWVKNVELDISTLIYSSELEEYLANGYEKGAIGSGRKNWTDDQRKANAELRIGKIWVKNESLGKTMLIKPEEFEFFELQGYVKGQLIFNPMN